MTQRDQRTYEPIEVDVTRVGGEPYSQMRPEQPKLANSLMQMFGLDPRAAALVTLVDLMMITLDILSGATFILIGIGVAAYIAFLVYKMQRKFFGDDHPFQSRSFQRQEGLPEQFHSRLA